MHNRAYQTQKIFFALGTVCTLTVYGDCYQATEKAKARVTEIHRAMNAFDPASEISGGHGHH